MLTDLVLHYFTYIQVLNAFAIHHCTEEASGLAQVCMFQNYMKCMNLMVIVCLEFIQGQLLLTLREFLLSH